MSPVNEKPAAFWKTISLIVAFTFVPVHAQDGSGRCDPAVHDLLKQYSEAMLKSGFLTKTPGAEDDKNKKIDQDLAAKARQEFEILQPAIAKALKQDPTILETIVRWEKKRETDLYRMVCDQQIDKLLKILNSGTLPTGMSAERNTTFEESMRPVLKNGTVRSDGSWSPSCPIHIRGTHLHSAYLSLARRDPNLTNYTVGADLYLLASTHPAFFTADLAKRFPDDFRWQAIQWKLDEPASAARRSGGAQPTIDEGMEAFLKLQTIANSCKAEKEPLPAAVFESLPEMTKLVQSSDVRKDLQNKLKDFVEAKPAK